MTLRGRAYKIILEDETETYMHVSEIVKATGQTSNVINKRLSRGVRHLYELKVPARTPKEVSRTSPWAGSQQIKTRKVFTEMLIYPLTNKPRDC